MQNTIAPSPSRFWLSCSPSNNGGTRVNVVQPKTQLERLPTLKANSFVVGRLSKLGDCKMDPNNVAEQYESGYTGETNAEGGNNGGDGVNNGGGDVVTLKKGPWTAAEDAVLIEYVTRHGEGNWNAVRKTTGLARCGKSCRLRWANHLRPNLKKGVFSPEEEELILKLHSQFGNKWAKMATLLPGRTDNEIKNYWNTRIKRRQRQGLPLYSQEPRHVYQNSPTPTSLTAPTTPTTPTGAPFQFQAQSHFSHSPSPQSHSPLTSPHPTTPTYNRVPLFNLASVSSPSSTPASSSFSFQRPSPILSSTLGFKRFRSSSGSYSLPPSYSACQLDQSAANQMPNFEAFQFPRTLITSSSSPMLNTQFDSDRVVASPNSIFPMNLELPSNQFSKVREQEITFDTNFNNGTSSSQIDHGELFGDWYENQALPSGPYDFKKENSMFDEYSGLDDLSSLYWPNSSSVMHSGLRFSEEEADMSKLMQGGLSRVLTTMPSSTQNVTEWFNDDQFSNGQSSFTTTDHHYNTYDLDMRPLNSLATLLPVASGSTHNETAAASYTWDNLPGLC